MRSIPLPIDANAPLDRSALKRLLDWIIDTHLADAIPGDAGLDIGPTQAHYDTRSAELEGLSRLFWGAAFAYKDGMRPASSDRLLEGLRTGSNPAHPSYWGDVGDNDQRAVEMAPLATALVENPELATMLGQTGMNQLCQWLAGIQTVGIHANNWRFFRILTMKALHKVGWEIDHKILADELAFIDSQYRSGGWYGDNPAGIRDYYNGFAFHFYGLLYARWCMEEDRERCLRFVERAREFALRYKYWFDDDGAHIAYGRSLTYRFATASFWPLLATFSHPDISLAEMRGLWSRSLSWWLHQPIFDGLGRLSIGYAYPNLLMSEFYNSPQSPLWAMKAFFPLALPDTHPFWLATPESCRYLDNEFVDADGLFLMQRRDGGAYMLPGAPVTHELRNTVDKYGKFAYSSRHGLCVEAGRWLGRGNLGDNILAFSPNEKDWYSRSAILDSSIANNELITWWSPLEGVTVETRQRFTEQGEQRVHIVDSQKALTFMASGHAVDGWKRYGLSFDLPRTGEPAAIGKTLYSDIADARGAWPRGLASTAPNTNMIFPQSVVPALSGRVPAGRTVIDTVLRYGSV